MARSAIRNDKNLEILATNPFQRGETVGTPNATGMRPESQVASLNKPTGTVTGTINDVLFKLGVEPTLTVREAAAILRWSYWKTRRYFRRVEGICVCYQPKRYKRPYRMFTIPVSVFAREWQKMTGQEPEAAYFIRQRLLTLIK